MRGEKLICDNRKARAAYSVEETYEAGLALLGTEVKALREGRANLKDSWAEVVEGEVWLKSCHISPYSHGTHVNHEPERPRKLLLHRPEIKRLTGKTAERGLTLIPLRLYFRRGIAKVELALARGKKLHDRREELKRRAAERDVERALKERIRK